MKWLLCIFLFAIPAFGQMHSHVNDSWERFDAMRILPPADLLNLEKIEDGYKLEYKVSTKLEVRYGTLTLTKDTQIAPEVLTKPKGKLIWILLCSLDQHVYAVTTVRPEQLKK